ncbi:cysteine-rich receptor-like protein kinase 29 [Quercus lobata]|uniref:cysteine-rich receptor-like protein kinase 29 n=1 Tax=Quercus lobata TaxID=97700 RepID=UPI00124707F9|nr:cysteine-rich receptor-like protein kinase 29 [Quercus lobata]
MSRGGILIPYRQLLAKISELVAVKLLSIVRDDDQWNLELIDEVFPYEVSIQGNNNGEHFKITTFLLCHSTRSHVSHSLVLQRDPYVLHDFSTSGNVSSNSTFRANLNTLISNLSSNTQINYGFYSFSAGEGTNKVYATGLCKADLTTTDCEFTPTRALVAGRVSNLTESNEVSRTLFYDLRVGASAGGDFGKVAVGNANYKSQNSTIYGLMQCSPDLSESDCSNCLVGAQSYFQDCCSENAGVRILAPSCNLRIEREQFYGSPLVGSSPLLSPPPAPAKSISPPPAPAKSISPPLVPSKGVKAGP